VGGCGGGGGGGGGGGSTTGRSIFGAIEFTAKQLITYRILITRLIDRVISLRIN